MLVAGAINGNIKVKGLDTSSCQADKSILTALDNTGAIISKQDSVISVKADKLKSFNFDATNCPDLFPPLAVLAANCDGISRIKGVGRLKHKESNRAVALVEELEKLNIKIEIQDDEMHIAGGPISGGALSSRQDHRIAMAGAVAALTANDKVEINHAESVSKSWPGFFKSLELIGGKIEYKGIVTK